MKVYEFEKNASKLELKFFKIGKTKLKPTFKLFLFFLKE